MDRKIDGNRKGYWLPFRSFVYSFQSIDKNNNKKYNSANINDIKAWAEIPGGGGGGTRRSPPFF